MNTIEQVKQEYFKLFDQDSTKQINIITDFNKKTYKLEKTNEPFTKHPQLPIFTSLNVVYGDTDSVFIKFSYNIQNDEINRINTFKYADECSKQITKFIDRHPIDLEFEKIFQPFILLSKKRYIAKKFEDAKNPFNEKCIDAKGVALVRRDYCKYVKNCYNEIINAIMYKNSSIQDTFDIYKKYVKLLMDNEIDIEDLTLSALLKASYKTKPIHVFVYEKLKERKEQVSIGDRIQYVYIKNGKAKKSECGEDPKYVVQNNIPLNKVFYIEQLSKAILGFYKCIVPQHTFIQLMDYTNKFIEEDEGKKLRLSDFKMEQE